MSTSQPLDGSLCLSLNWSQFVSAAGVWAQVLLHIGSSHASTTCCTAQPIMVSGLGGLGPALAAGHKSEILRAGGRRPHKQGITGTFSVCGLWATDRPVSVSQGRRSSGFQGGGGGGAVLSSSTHRWDMLDTSATSTSTSQAQCAALQPVLALDPDGQEIMFLCAACSAIFCHHMACVTLYTAGYDQLWAADLIWWCLWPLNVIGAINAYDPFLR